MGSHRHDGKRRLELLMAVKLLQNSALTISPRLPLLTLFLRRALQKHPSARAAPIDSLSQAFVKQAPAIQGNCEYQTGVIQKKIFYTTGQGNQSAGEILNGLFLS